MLNENQRNQILRFDTCKVANALERLRLRLRNEGFTRPGLHCVTGGYPVVLGYAVTSRVKTADPPLRGSFHFDLLDWWSLIASRPGPLIALIQDVDHNPGQGAVLSDVHAEVLRALNCHGVITNGAVRNLPSLAEMGFPAFSQFVTASHAYIHLVDFDVPVEILGLRVKPGDLVFADVHGALVLPDDALDDIIRVTNEQATEERSIIDLCRGPAFSIASLREALRAGHAPQTEVSTREHS